MKKLNPKIVIAFILILVLYSCKNDEGSGGDTPLSIVGKWSINTQDYTLKNASGDVIEDDNYTYGSNLFTFEFKEDGTFIFIDVEEGDWFGGTYTYNESTKELKLTIFGDQVEGEIQNLSATSITIFISGTFTDGGISFTEENIFTGSLNSGSVATISLEELQNKWSIKELIEKVYVDVNEDDDYDEIDELYQTINLTNIPHNRFTVEFKDGGDLLSIDSYLEGEWYEESWDMLDGSNIVLNDFESETLLHLMSISGDTYTFSITTYDYEEIEGDYFYTKTVGTVKVEMNDGSEASISGDDFFDDWEITAFTEFRNGEEDEGEGGVPLGTIITFNSDGTGFIDPGSDGFALNDVMLVDPSNIYFEFEEGEDMNYVLLNIQSYNSTTGVMEVIEGKFEEDYDPELEEDVIVQKESHITLEKE